MWEKTKGFLAVTAQDARLGEALGLPCVCLYYRIGEKGTLQRAQLSLSGRGGLMGIYDGGGLSAAQPDRLARDIQAECTRRGFGGVVLDFRPAEEALSRLESLCAALLHRRERKKCVLCGGWYIPKSNRAKYCPECAKEEERRKTRERVRRHRAAM